MEKNMEIKDFDQNIKLDLVNNNEELNIFFFHKERKKCDFSLEINVYWKNSWVNIKWKVFNYWKEKKINIKIILHFENQFWEIDLKWVWDWLSNTFFCWAWIIKSNSIQSSIKISEKILLFWKKSFWKALPILTIESENVKEASHKASISPLNEELLFYLKTKILDENICKKLITKWFLWD